MEAAVACETAAARAVVGNAMALSDVWPAAMGPGLRIFAAACFELFSVEGLRSTRSESKATDASEAVAGKG